MAKRREWMDDLRRKIYLNSREENLSEEQPRKKPKIPISTVDTNRTCDPKTISAESDLNINTMEVISDLTTSMDDFSEIGFLCNSPDLQNDTDSFHISVTIESDVLADQNVNSSKEVSEILPQICDTSISDKQGILSPSTFAKTSSEENSRNPSPVAGTSFSLFDRGETRNLSPLAGTSSALLDNNIENELLDNIQYTPDHYSPVAKEEERYPKRYRKKLNLEKSYLDFADEADTDTLLLNEAFPSENSNSGWSDEDDSSGFSHTRKSNKKGKTKHTKRQIASKDSKNRGKENTNNVNRIESISIEKAQTKKTSKKKNELKKNKGESYINEKGTTIAAKYMRSNPCIGKKCGNDCGNITEDRRSNLFTYFWELKSHQRRKDWIAQCIVRKTVKKPSEKALFKRSITYEYFINEGEGRRKVCQKFLIETLDVTQRFILYTLNTSAGGFAKTDERGKSGGHNKTSAEVVEHAKKFILSLPFMPSHYCRKDSTWVYLPDEFKNTSNLYRIYEDHCENDDAKRMSFKVFCNWFRTNYNVGFHVPKKDKCIMCMSLKTYDVKTEEEIMKINKHIEEKEASYKRFSFHQNLHNLDKSVICASFDMQKVLNTPHGECMTLYYSRKISVYNFTIYESKTQTGYCNIWTEADAHRGANEISTCLLNYIQNVDARGNVKTLLLYSDSCFGQNKNKIVLSMLRYALSNCTNLEVIQMNYLIPGHTYMPVDSMHATIERAVRKSIIWAPSQWPTVVELARKNPIPYKVSVLEGGNFMGFDEILNNTFNKNQKIYISKMNVATFKKSKPNIMYVKNSMLPQAATMEVPLLFNNNMPKANLYPSKLPISLQKYNDLKKLVEKQVIPKMFAKEYLNLKYSGKVADRLGETDQEDN